MNQESDSNSAPMLTGRRVLVTGGSSGIGEAVTARLAAAGAAVVAADIAVADTDADGAGPVVGPAGSVTRCHLDVTDPGSAEAAVAAFAGDGLDVLINAAGINGHYVPLAELEVDQWDHTMAVNVRGTFLMMKAALPLLAAGPSSSIVNVSSGAGRRGFANLADYVASKHAVIGLTRAAALEYGRTSVRINAVCPGTVRTPMLESFAGSMEMVEKMGRMAPIGRVGEPDEIASMIAWLCTDAASFVTGAVLDCDGGVSAA